jgi:hypothetical protein
MPARRPASPAVVVVLAAVGALLAGVAGTGSYLGVSNYLRNQPPTQGPGGGGTQTSAAAPKSCPEFTASQVRNSGQPGELTVLMYVRGPHQGSRVDGEAWICRDSNGTLYYQGHDLDGETPEIDVNTILVGGAIRGTVSLQGSTYVAAVQNGAYRVSCEEFAFVNNGGSRSDYTPQTCLLNDGPTALSRG